ncbi:MAG: hypothetical protein BroJett003_23880 [Planctomycetota bacterium]|nr:MAG: hypothetical protein BroJett003_23880 [Planctomycetota bacterium]
MTRFETQDDPRRELANDFSARVRMNAGSAGLGAAGLLFFGFLYLAKPGTSLGDALSAQNWFAAGHTALFYTMRVGGVVLGLVALASLTGAWPVLAADALASIPVGAMLIASGVLMLMGSGDALQSGLLLIFGVMYIRAGVSNGRFALTAGRLRQAGWPPQPHAQPPPAPQLHRPTSEANLAGEVLRRRSGSPYDSAARYAAADTAEGGSQAAPAGPPPAWESRTPTVVKRDAAATTDESGAPPEGFLASFARRREDE